MQLAEHYNGSYKKQNELIDGIGLGGAAAFFGSDEQPDMSLFISEGGCIIMAHRLENDVNQLVEKIGPERALDIARELGEITELLDAIVPNEKAASR